MSRWFVERPRARGTRGQSVRLWLVLVGVGALACGYISVKFDLSPRGDSGAGGDSLALPFDIPDAAAVDGKLVFAHYFPPYPISIDNADPTVDHYAKQYLSVDGEHNEHQAYSALLRDRPTPRLPLADDQWRQRDLETEVRQAEAAGINGFSVNIMTPSSDETWWGAGVPDAMLQAAATVDPAFKIMLMPDMSAEINVLTPQELASELAQYVSHPSVFMLPDGRLVVSPFLAENKPPSWWVEFISAMRDEHGVDVALVPVFLDVVAQQDAFVSISYGMSNWGNRSPRSNSAASVGPDAPAALAEGVHSLGKIWMQSVSFQDVRPSQSIFDEAENSQNLRDTWAIAIESGSEWVQLTTWNDYSEGTSFAPSVGHGRALLDLNAYWLYWFRTGVAPTILRDTAYLIYRSQPVSAVPLNSSSSPMTLRGGSSLARDIVEVVTALTDAGTVDVTVGGTTTTCEVPAGIGTCVVPLEVGSVVATVTRGSTVAAHVSSHLDITATPYNQNLEYLVDSSRR